MKTLKQKLVAPLLFTVAFSAWTIALRLIDVQAIGPDGSRVGLATLNRFFHELTGVHFSLYILTDWLGLIPFGICAVFGALGLLQWIKHRDLRKVDRDLLLLGGFYLAVIACYGLFEVVVINYRPILIEGVREASYPSSTTMLSLCVSLTAAMQVRTRVRQTGFRRLLVGVIIAFATFMVVTRAVCGVHWLSDIIGGVLLSLALITAYNACASDLI